MKICKKCNKTWQDEFNLCPMCGVELMPEKLVHSDSISMGDGNAINGGIHVTKDSSSKDDHSISNSNNTSNSNNKTTNISSHHIYNGNYTNIERELTQEELLHEQKLKYRECCKKALVDGLITREERLWLEEQKSQLGISQEVAEEVINDVRKSLKTFVPMSVSQEVQLENLKVAIENNMVRNIINLLPKIHVIQNKVQNEEMQYLYYMVLTALKPEECIKQYKNSIGVEDNYWLTFWTYIAYCKIGDVINAERVVLELHKWGNCKPSEDIELLEIIGYLIIGEKDVASEIFCRCITGEQSSELSHISDVVSSILFYNPEDIHKSEVLSHSNFYIEYFFSDFYNLEKEAFKNLKEQKLAKQKAEEEALKKAEQTIKEAEEKTKILNREREKFTIECDKRRKELDDFAFALNNKKQIIDQDKNFLHNERSNFEVECRNREQEYRVKEKELIERNKKILQTERQNLEVEYQRKNNELLEKENSQKEKEKNIQETQSSLQLKIDNIEEEKNNIKQMLRKVEESELRVKEQEEKYKNEYEQRLRGLTEWSNTLQEEQNKINSKSSELTKEQDKLKEEANKLLEDRKKIEETSKRISELEDKEKVLQISCKHLEVKILEYQESIKRLEQYKKRLCPKCGEVVSEDTKFCRKCGTKIL